MGFLDLVGDIVSKDLKFIARIHSGSIHFSATILNLNDFLRNILNLLLPKPDISAWFAILFVCYR